MITKPCRNLKEILNSVCETTGSSFKTANLILLNQKPLVVYINTAKMPCCGLQNFNYHYSLQMEEHRWRVSFKKSPTNYGNGNSNNHCSCCRLFRVSERHSLDIKPLYLMKLSSQTLGNLPWFWIRQPKLLYFSIFNFLFPFSLDNDWP